tara:strand:+ start:291 stop:500 length:210 start_codon:yes stop_codon:yes gene_type:complete
MATVKARIVANPNVRAKQVSIGASSVNLATKSIQELSDVEATETNKGLLQYDQASDKWKTTTVIDGGTF